MALLKSRAMSLTSVSVRRLEICEMEAYRELDESNTYNNILSAGAKYRGPSPHLQSNISSAAKLQQALYDFPRSNNCETPEYHIDKKMLGLSSDDIILSR